MKSDKHQRYNHATSLLKKQAKLKLQSKQYLTSDHIWLFFYWLQCYFQNMKDNMAIHSKDFKSRFSINKIMIKDKQIGTHITSAKPMWNSSSVIPKDSRYIVQGKSVEEVK